MDLELQNRVAIVTGASRGIGKAIALALAGAGAQPWLVSRNDANLTAARDEIRARTGITPAIVAGDVADGALPARVIDAVMKQHGRLDILVNNAEGPPMGSFTEHDDGAWDAAIQRNLLGTIRFARAAVPLMKQRKWGRIVNISSVQAKEPSPAMVLSATTRAGVSAFAKAISVELAPFGITVNTVCPSAVLTDRMVNLTNAAATREGKTYDEILDQAKKTIPMGRFSTPEEIADLVTFLASSRAAYVTGVSMMIDGGLSKSIF